MRPTHPRSCTFVAESLFVPSVFVSGVFILDADEPKDQIVNLIDVDQIVKLTALRELGLVKLE